VGDSANSHMSVLMFPLIGNAFPEAPAEIGRR
jgi:hypothetical protein